MKVLKATEHDIGHLIVRRFLPGNPKMVGPFIFFDHFGPAQFEPNQGIDVRPHPHCHLATVTYLFEGGIQHKDSLGSNQLIEPGAVNWMVAGKGIVHSERTPESLRQSGSSIGGIQCWLALPAEHDSVDPDFTHHPAASLPVIKQDGIKVRLLIGDLLGEQSPVKAYGEVLYADVELKPGKLLELPNVAKEVAVYIVSGDVRVNGIDESQHSLIVLPDNAELAIEAKTDCRLMLLGGDPVGDRFIEWNFVGSTKEQIKAAKDEWRRGPSENGGRFPVIASDAGDYIPLPPDKECGEDSGVM